MAQTLRPVSPGAVARDARLVAPDLLGLVLRHGDLAGRIVEVEAYCGAEDPASHAYRGRTVRNATMFGPAGHLYVYRSYGVHWCANVVCGEEDEGAAVLLRAFRPMHGLAEMRTARTARRRPGARVLADHELCRGPGCLCQALGIAGEHDGADLLAGDRGVHLEDDGWRPPAVHQGRRVGISAAQDEPWRWWVADAPEVSRRRSGDALASCGPNDSVVALDPGLDPRLT